MESTRHPAPPVSLIFNSCSATNTPKEADDYVVSPKNSKLRALLVTRVVVGKPYKIRNTATDILEPPCGHHSVSDLHDNLFSAIN